MNNPSDETKWKELSSMSGPDPAKELQDFFGGTTRRTQGEFVSADDLDPELGLSEPSPSPLKSEDEPAGGSGVEGPTTTSDMDRTLASTGPDSSDPDSSGPDIENSSEPESEKSDESPASHWNDLASSLGLEAEDLTEPAKPATNEQPNIDSPKETDAEKVSSPKNVDTADSTSHGKTKKSCASDFIGTARIRCRAVW